MNTFNRKSHWENIYEKKSMTEVSWYQSSPISLELISELNLPKDVKIIDVGGGDSFLADNLLASDYQDISVLDISEKAIEKAQKRLKNNTKKIHWIVSDIVDFVPKDKFHLWHDRAAFHFLKDTKDIAKYVDLVKHSVVPNGYLIIETFSTNGPTKCSGIEIQQYSKETLQELFQPEFQLISSQITNHKTPFDTIQNFVFCVFQKKI